MKILLLGFAKLRIMPYMNFYLDSIDCERHEVHVLYWNRDLKNEDTSKYKGVIFHEFRQNQQDEVAKVKKLNSFIHYRNYANELLKSIPFDKVVILHSLPGILVLDTLIRRYAHKYILDYRDSTYEFFTPFRMLIHQLIKYSACTFTSSDAFRKYFPKKYEKKIYTVHNILVDSLSHRDYNKVKSEKIRLAFWGQIRHEEINKKLIDRVGNDRRIELHYYGREQNIALNLKKYVGEKMFDNVFFHGEYVPEDRYEFVKKTDIINNIYCDGNMLLAMGNKYYDGLIFRLPQVCMVGSFMAELCEENGICCMLSPDDVDFSNKLVAYYKSLDMESFKNNADKALAKVLAEYESASKILKNQFA